MKAGQKFIVIIGSPRSGTTWLQALLGTHPAFCASGELFLFTDYISKWVDSWKRIASRTDNGLNMGLPTILTRQEFYSYLQDFIKYIYKRVHEKKPSADFLVDKQPGNALYVELINELVPDTTFIHIIRDGRDVAASMLAASQSWGDFWAPKDIHVAAKQWRKYVLSARVAKQYTDRYIEVKYESLSMDGVRTLGSIFQSLGVCVSVSELERILTQNTLEKMRRNFSSARKDDTKTSYTVPSEFFRKGTVGSWEEELSFIQRYRFNRVAGDLLESLQYAEPGWWYKNISIRALW